MNAPDVGNAVRPECPPHDAANVFVVAGRTGRLRTPPRRGTVRLLALG